MRSWTHNSCPVCTSLDSFTVDSETAVRMHSRLEYWRTSYITGLRETNIKCSLTLNYNGTHLRNLCLYPDMLQMWSFWATYAIKDPFLVISFVAVCAAAFLCHDSTESSYETVLSSSYLRLDNSLPSSWSLTGFRQPFKFDKILHILTFNRLHRAFNVLMFFNVGVHVVMRH